MPLWIVLTQWVGRLILVLLIGLSVWSVTIMLDRRKFFKTQKFDLNRDDFEAFIQKIKGHQFSKKGDHKAEHIVAAFKNSIYTQTLEAGLEPPFRTTDSVDRSVAGFLAQQKKEMEKGLTVLATLGSNAPFIGLLGTVLGIIQAFGELAGNKQDTSAVITGISEALVATAIGLFVAIPAVVAFNYFGKKIKLILTDCERVKDHLISRVVD